MALDLVQPTAIQRSHRWHLNVHVNIWAEREININEEDEERQPQKAPLFDWPVPECVLHIPKSQNLKSYRKFTHRIDRYGPAFSSGMNKMMWKQSNELIVEFEISLQLFFFCVGHRNSIIYLDLCCFYLVVFIGKQQQQPIIIIIYMK